MLLESTTTPLKKKGEKVLKHDGPAYRYNDKHDQESNHWKSEKKYFQI